jgi:hypothetical protein
MTRDQARNLKAGDTVYFLGELCDLTFSVVRAIVTDETSRVHVYVRPLAEAGMPSPMGCGYRRPMVPGELYPDQVKAAKALWKRYADKMKLAKADLAGVQKNLFKLFGPVESKKHKFKTK